MNKKGRRLFSIFLALVTCFTIILGSVGFAQAASYDKTKKAFEKCGEYIYETVKNPVVGSIGGDWVIYGLGHGGYEMSEQYIESYVNNLKAEMEKGFRGIPGILHDKKFTEYSRVIVACSAIGLDASNIGGYNLIEPLADFVNIKWQGMNGPVWALIALDSGNYEVPKKEADYPYGTLTENETDRQNTREKMINYILENQLDDGGWNLQPKESYGAGYNSVSDVDITAMAMISLAPYMNKTRVKKAVNKAITFLSEAQQSNGGFGSWGTLNSESCAQAICGLLACGVNPNTDKRFIKNGNSVVDALMSFYDENVGGFRHVNTASGGYEPVVNQMSTEQGYYALAFYYKMVPGKTQISKAIKSGNGNLKVSFKKANINTDYLAKKKGKTAKVSGYQIVCATDKKFSKNVKTIYTGEGSLSKTITGLKKGKTYYVKVCAYKTVNGKKIYGAYSQVKSVKV